MLTVFAHGAAVHASRRVRAHGRRGVRGLHERFRPDRGGKRSPKLIRTEFCRVPVNTGDAIIPATVSIGVALASPIEANMDIAGIGGRPRLSTPPRRLAATAPSPSAKPKTAAPPPPEEKPDHHHGQRSSDARRPDPCAASCRFTRTLTIGYCSSEIGSKSAKPRA